ncbi:MAG: hypothetical protein O3A46_08760 [Candidatus Poribacteria bacterium]|nr:hypothetical protein [Candidatus Poribacteria bacterium]
MERLMNIDRRIIFLVLAAVVLLGIALKPVIPMATSAESKSLFDTIERVPTGGAVMIGLDYPPASKDELDAMSRAALHHAFARDLRVLAFCFDQQGLSNAGTIVKEVAAAHSKMNGTDYAFLGFQPDMVAAVDQMNTSIASAFATVAIDGTDSPTAELPVMAGLESYKDIALIVSMSGSKNYENWIDYANARSGVKVGIGATGAIATGIYPFLGSGQVFGMLRSTRGASDYERLVRDAYPNAGLKPDASEKMSVQFLAHLLILAFIALANVGYWLSRRKGAQI